MDMGMALFDDDAEESNQPSEFVKLSKYQVNISNDNLT